MDDKQQLENLKKTAEIAIGSLNNVILDNSQKIQMKLIYGDKGATQSFDSLANQILLASKDLKICSQVYDDLLNKEESNKD